MAPCRRVACGGREAYGRLSDKEERMLCDAKGRIGLARTRRRTKSDGTVRRRGALDAVDMLSVLTPGQKGGRGHAA